MLISVYWWVCGCAWRSRCCWCVLVGFGCEVLGWLVLVVLWVVSVQILVACCRGFLWVGLWWFDCAGFVRMEVGWPAYSWVFVG